MAEASKHHFVTLVGSLREGSLHGALARALPGLAPAGVRMTSLASIGALPHYNSDVQARGFPPEVQAMGEQIAAADGVIVLTPEYNYSVPGVLKNAIDWLSRLNPQPFAGKAVAIQSVSMGLLGGVRVHYHLRQMLVYLDAFVLNKPEIMVAQGQNKLDVAAGTITDETTRGLVATQLQALAALADKLAGRQTGK